MANTSAVASSGKLAKPQLRGYAQRYVRRHLIGAITLSMVGAIAWKYLVAEPRKRRYAEFYSTYDVAKEEARLKSLGLYDNPFPFDD
ncbi:cytochrome c oxidase subunit 6C-like [Oppia nitens]|uniref:cytochrome c oxidase subunit 6C-like n=1 Tax=Oppia nitens TaxID=1686743 RepID=UPI0023DBD592|nr:cytochrome c oxidase subunit 6C-like [Oppia nitens]